MILLLVLRVRSLHLVTTLAAGAFTEWEKYWADYKTMTGGSHNDFAL